MQLHHICIQTDCYASSLAFYTGALGMRVVKETAGFHGRAFNTWLSGDGVLIELQTPKEGACFAPFSKDAAGVQHVCFLVDNLDEAYAGLCGKPGVRFQRKDGAAIYTVEGGRLLKMIAPEGTIIELRDSPGC